MAAITITLDVTPPAVVYGPPARTGDLRARVPYAISSDGAITAATVDLAAAEIAADAITSTQAYPTARLLEVASEAVDDVGNRRVQSVTVWLGPIVRIGRALSRVVTRVGAAGRIGDRVEATGTVRGRVHVQGGVADG